MPTPNYLFPVEALSRVFRGKFLEALIDLYQSGALADARLDPRSFRTLTRTLSQHDWVVYAKPAFGGPTPIVNYLGRYTHRVALSNSRLLSITDDAITFRTRGQGTCSLPPDEFIRRFLLHVLPHRFVKIRHYGLLAPANVHTRLARAQQILADHTRPTPDSANGTPPIATSDSAADTAADEATPDTATDGWPRCPHCGTGRLRRLSTSARLGSRRYRNAPPPYT